MIGALGFPKEGIHVSLKEDFHEMKDEIGKGNGIPSGCREEFKENVGTRNLLSTKV